MRGRAQEEDAKRGLGFRRGPLCGRRSEGSVPGFCVGRQAFRCLAALDAVQLANGLSFDLPERDLDGGRVLAFVDFLLVDVAYERAFDVDVIALAQLRRGVFAQTVPGDDAVPLGLRVPLLICALPSALRRERKDGVLPARLFRGLLLRVPAEITDEMNSVLVHCVSPFLPL